ncbi:predicted protein [Botrytis cinerea T4]|uniref:Uncharacterized protein n=1 Tax=Botryotinia fuckeliana (strain T4) TaxID=999810 RepID=G2XS69_BOTF4|nr:predicted protein [Botrytis cinerea T4]
MDNGQYCVQYTERAHLTNGLNLARLVHQETPKQVITYGRITG